MTQVIITNHKNLFDIINIKKETYEITLTNHGAGIIDLKTFDYKGTLESIALGYQDIDKFFHDDDYYFGKTIGPIAGRIFQGTYTLDGEVVELEINDKKLNSNLHSGPNGIAMRNFEYSVDDDKTKTVVTFRITESNDDKYINYTIIYTLYNDYFTIENKAFTNHRTIINMTNHVYFNLTGDFKTNVLGHQLKLDCNIYKTGNDLKQVNETFNFNTFKTFGKDITSSELSDTKGYDHYFKFNNDHTVYVYEPSNKRYLEASGNSNGVVIYTGGYFHGEKSQSGMEYQQYDGFTLEFQNMPNGINTTYQDEKSIQDKDTEFYQIMTFKFGVKKGTKD